MQEKWGIVSACSGYMNDKRDKLQYGAVKIVRKLCNCSERTIRRVLKEFRSKGGFESTSAVDLTPRKKGVVGSKKLLTYNKRARILRQNLLKKGRASIRKLSEVTQIPKSTLHIYCKDMKCQYETSWLKPKLNEVQKTKRLDFVTKLRRGNSHAFQDQLNTIVVDESWFYLYDARVKIRTFPGKPRPQDDQVQHKSHIPKIMFLTALARPSEEHRFNGKICIQRVCQEKIAKRRSTHHQKGDRYMEDCNINHHIYEDLMKVVIDNVKAKMPWLHGQPVIIQQDGASPHTAHGVIQRLGDYGSTDGWNIKLVTQPPQSPDLNINDLSFFRSLKMRVNSLKKGARSLDQLYDAVLEAWDSDTLKVLWGH